MSSRTWQMRVQDILHAILAIQQRTAGKMLRIFKRMLASSRNRSPLPTPSV
jgi:hypothetical protein